MLYIFPIVEGQGDERATPVLIRNLFHNRFHYFEIEVLHPYRLPKGKMKIANEWPPVLSLAVERLNDRASAAGDKALLLVMCDADDDCPVELKSTIEEYLVGGAGNITVEFVAPSPEYETWFLSAAQSYINHADCVDEILVIPNFNEIRGAKEYFERNILRPNRYYSETVDQAKFSSILDFSTLPERNCRSLRRFIDIFARLID